MRGMEKTWPGGGRKRGRSGGGRGSIIHDTWMKRGEGHEASGRERAVG